MKVVHFDDAAWVKDHPTGSIAFQHLLHGEPDAPDNYAYVLGRQDSDFSMPRHRHNFDQIRLPLRGTMNHGDGIVLGEGEVAYIPEGLAYGPQDDPVLPYEPGERRQLVIQFGGASGHGFLSFERRRAAQQELLTKGRFVGPFYERHDGSSTWSLNAIWEHAHGEPIAYADPCYKSIIIADPKRFRWTSVGGVEGVQRKFLGAFTERGVWIEFVRMRTGATWSTSDARARRLLTVLQGAGNAAGTALERLSAVEIGIGESLAVTATSDLHLFLVGLPPIDLPIDADRDEDEERTQQAALAGRS